MAGETISNRDPLPIIDAFVEANRPTYTPERAAEVAFVQEQIHAVLPLVEDTQAVNNLLTSADRSDLVIHKRVDMDPITDLAFTNPHELESFPSSLCIPPHADARKVTRHDVDAIIAGTFRRNENEIGGPFISTEIGGNYYAVIKPVTQRACVVAPDLMAHALVQASDEANREKADRAVETIAVYALERYLVDANDRYVSGPDYLKK